MRRTVSLVVAVAALVAAFAVPAGAHGRPYCGLVWASTPEVAGQSATAPVVALRAGRHTCHDRLVFEFDGAVSGYRAEYVPAAAAEGSGAPLAVRGGAIIEVTVLAPAQRDGAPTHAIATPAATPLNMGGFRTFRDVVSAGTFEGQTTVALGVRARLPFRVFTLAGPAGHSRIVVDVAHRW